MFRQMFTRKWGHELAQGRATFLLDCLRDFEVVPSSAFGHSSLQLHSQSTEERASLDTITSMAIRAWFPV